MPRVAHVLPLVTGCLITGCVLSRILIHWLQLIVFRHSSVAVQVTSCSPVLPHPLLNPAAV